MMRQPPPPLALNLGILRFHILAKNRMASIGGSPWWEQDLQQQNGMREYTQHPASTQTWSSHPSTAIASKSVRAGNSDIKLLIAILGTLLSVYSSLGASKRATRCFWATHVTAAKVVTCKTIQKLLPPPPKSNSEMAPQGHSMKL